MNSYAKPRNRSNRWIRFARNAGDLKNEKPHSSLNGIRRVRALRKPTMRCEWSDRWLGDLREERSRRQIEKARNDAEREHLRQTCLDELNAQPGGFDRRTTRTSWRRRIWSPRKRNTTR